jgi:beta-lactamase regulating signal transducer with metallopeptidase domain
MIERAVVEYLANSLWQVPLLAGGAWLLIWAVRPGPRTQHGVWLVVLGLAVLLPVRGMGSAGGFETQARSTDVSPELRVVVAPVVASVFDPQALVIRDDETERPLVKQEPVRRDWSAFGPRVRRVSLSATVVHWLVGVYGATILFGMFRVTQAWRAARRLVEDSRETTVCTCEVAHLQGYGERLGVRLPEFRESCAVSSPMIVGLVSPVLLLPEGFGRHTHDEVRAALCHELAHVKRRDYLVNLICQVVALPVSWHPVTHAVQQRIRRTREMVCDAMAAREMLSEISYAKCLLAMARSMLGGVSMVERAEGVGLFGNNILEERVMRLTETKTAVSLRTKMVRAASGATMMIATTAMAAMFHVVPTMAEQNTLVAQSAPVAVGVSSPETASSAPAAPVAVIVPDGAPDALGALIVPDGVSAVPVAQTVPAPAVAPVAPAPAPQSAPAPELAPVPPVPALEAVPAPKLAPIAPMAPVAPMPPVPALAAPAPPAVPPAPDGKGRKAIHVFRGKGGDGESYVIVNGEQRDLTPEEKSQVDKAVAEAKAKLDSPEFKKQMEDARKQVAEAAARFNSLEFKKQIADAQKQAAMAKDFINSPELKRQMDEARKQMAESAARFSSPEFRKQIEDAARQGVAASKNFPNSPEFKHQMDEMRKQMAETTANLNSLEFKKQIEDAARQNSAAKDFLNSPEFKKQMEDASKAMGDAAAKFNSAEFKQQMKEFQEQFRNGDLQRCLDDAARKHDETKSAPQPQQ